MMELNSTLASQSYQQALSATKPLEPAAEDNGAPSFFQKFATDFVSTMQEGEATARAGLTGQADAHSVVEALAATELAVETAVTVRDKVVEAYQEILRMPV